MRCKNHIADHSSSVGVCASCLRERLVAAQAQVQAHVFLAQSLSAAASDPYPPPPHHLAFPRSVSPYISRRKSDDSPWHQNHHDHRHHRHRHHRVPSDRRFFSTPQVGPTHGNTAASAAAVPGKKKRGKFSLFSSMFRSRSDQSDSEPRVSNVSSSSSPNWFASVIAGRRKKPAPMPDAHPFGGHPPCRMNDRGMSPDDDSEGSPWASGYSSEAWRTPVTAPASTARRGRSGHALNVSGLAFCLSPLVRASPGRHRNQKQMPAEAGYSGEIRASNKPHLSSAASYCANRSRKLADFGRSTQNH